jgi:hypothetical protein
MKRRTTPKEHKIYATMIEEVFTNRRIDPLEKNRRGVTERS